MRRDRRVLTAKLSLLHVVLTFVLFSAYTGVCLSDDHGRVLADGQLPQDRRLNGLKDLDGHFPFDVPASATEWQERADSLRRQVLVATGLWPLPERTPLKPVIHGRVERDGFTVEKVYFESIPNQFVTGLLFRPVNKKGPLPAVLCPHGHGGRLQDYGERGVRELITQGAERFEDCGRYPKLSRCVQLARMGCVTFIFDMLGYADNTQLSRQLAHRFSKQRPDFDRDGSWGFYGPQAELRLQSIMGLQMWNCVRALDFLTGLPDVDPERVGVTGGSGGGTQTILLCAIDTRPVVAFPQGMVSTSMQGGCTCENCSLLRIDTGNVELAALFAPKPQAMTAADDWTSEMMTDGFPQLKSLYGLLGASDKVECTSLTHFKHNYNYVTRALMYAWFNKHLDLGLEEPIVEDHWEPLTEQEWTIWDEQHPAPGGGPDHERYVTKWLDDDAQQTIAKLHPTDLDSWQEYQRVIGGAFETLLPFENPGEGSLSRENVLKEPRDDYIFFKDLLRDSSRGIELPALSFYPMKSPWNQQVVIWVSGQGKAGTLTEDGEPHPMVHRLLDAGYSVISVDLLYQGEFLEGAAALTAAPVVDNPREYAGFTYAYNLPVFAERVQDLLTVISFVRDDEHGPERVHLLGVGGAEPVVTAARMRAGKLVDRAAIAAGGFRFAGLDSYRDPDFLPGAVKYGDLPAMIALCAPHSLWIGDVDRLPDLPLAAYRSLGAADAIETSVNGGVEAAVSWLIGK